MDLYEIYEEVESYVNNKTNSLETRAKRLVDYYYNTDDRTEIVCEEGFEVINGMWRVFR